MAKVKSEISLEALEPLVDRLLAGPANVKEVAQTLADWGYPATLDQTEQLRLALSLLECHDDGSRNRTKPEATGAAAAKKAKALAKAEKAVPRPREADFSP
ncbi:MAG: hypothetical protein J0L82_09465 [Deltaproteobacteria bacterium]|nr:hypothetical protein [Deltaproteobacteria bacterium]